MDVTIGYRAAGFHGFSPSILSIMDMVLVMTFQGLVGLDTDSWAGD